MGTTPGEMREAAARDLEGPGRRRLDLLAELELLEEELRPLIKNAVRMEVPQRQIQGLTGLSRNTIIAWTRDRD